MTEELQSLFDLFFRRNQKDKKNHLKNKTEENQENG
jgi:hypothetical protein